MRLHSRLWGLKVIKQCLGWVFKELITAFWCWKRILIISNSLSAFQDFTQLEEGLSASLGHGAWPEEGSQGRFLGDSNPYKYMYILLMVKIQEGRPTSGYQMCSHRKQVFSWNSFKAFFSFSLHCFHLHQLMDHRQLTARQTQSMQVQEKNRTEILALLKSQLKFSCASVKQRFPPQLLRYTVTYCCFLPWAKWAVLTNWVRSSQGRGQLSVKDLWCICSWKVCWRVSQGDARRNECL